jgi:hypothetical protein
MGKFAVIIDLSICLIAMLAGCCHIQPSEATPLPPGAQSHSRFHPVPTAPVFLPRNDLGLSLPCPGGMNGPSGKIEEIPPGPVAEKNEQSKLDSRSSKAAQFPPAPTPDDMYPPEDEESEEPVLAAPKRLADAAVGGARAVAKSKGSWIFTPSLPQKESPIATARLPAELLEPVRANNRPTRQ